MGGTVDDRIALAEEVHPRSPEKTGGKSRALPESWGISRQPLYYMMAKHGIDKSPS